LPLIVQMHFTTHGSRGRMPVQVCGQSTCNHAATSCVIE